MELNLLDEYYHCDGLVLISVKGGIKAEGTGGFLPLQINIPNLYPKLLYPVYGIEKVSILNFLHLQVNLFIGSTNRF